VTEDRAAGRYSSFKLQWCGLTGLDYHYLYWYVAMIFFVIKLYIYFKSLLVVYLLITWQFGGSTEISEKCD
jgi:hypothetical protein